MADEQSKGHRAGDRLSWAAGSRAG